MKKKISLLGLVLILVLGFTGCSRSTMEYDQTELEQYANFIVQNFSGLPDEQLDSFSEISELELDLTLLNAGVPISGEDFLTMIDAWQAGEEECGAFIGIGEYTAETTNDGVTLSAEAEYEDRNATIEFAFDDEMNMESITVSADYTTGEILQKAGLNTILGMGTVFVVLIFLSFVIWLLKFIPVLETRFRKSGDAEDTAQTPDEEPERLQPAAEEINPSEDEELAAVIAAAIAAAEGTSTDGFVVRSIRRRKSNKW
ncbi:MAG TPA: OadG family protein [Candidatus Mediterraneibacter stercoravium]|uniref:OadG family protein n=1 Tax=Candidatus Mediterraneibacter stercoravium TaxID=2838685 RepID=A0A9D2G7J3_9FIRM|nr:OadG family protein [Candidatus Mediterraneibacter stercoravium]